MVVKYRNLNQVRIGDNFQLPLIANIVDTLGSVKLFSTLGNAMGPFQTPLKSEDQSKTTLSTDKVHFQY
jgi:hypothetical protein